MRGVPNPLPSRRDLQQAFCYNGATGVLTWRSGPKAGKIAGGISKCGYMNVRYGGRAGGLILSHRIIWKIITGKDPIEIDHINNNKLDNRFVNLREADKHGNGCNKLLTKSNTSGFKGVSWKKRTGKWQARVCVNYKSIFLGYFSSPEDAHSAYLAAAKELHGKFHNPGTQP